MLHVAMQKQISNIKEVSIVLPFIEFFRLSKLNFLNFYLLNFTHQSKMCGNPVKRQGSERCEFRLLFSGSNLNVPYFLSSQNSATIKNELKVLFLISGPFVWHP